MSALKLIIAIAYKEGMCSAAHICSSTMFAYDFKTFNLFFTLVCCMLYLQNVLLLFKSG